MFFLSDPVKGRDQCYASVHLNINKFLRCLDSSKALHRENCNKKVQSLYNVLPAL